MYDWAWICETVICIQSIVYFNHNNYNFVNIGPAVSLGTERSPVVGAPPLITEWRKPDHPGVPMTIELDAPLQGWGTTCNGNQTRGPWSVH